MKYLVEDERHPSCHGPFLPPVEADTRGEAQRLAGERLRSLPAEHEYAQRVLRLIPEAGFSNPRRELLDIFRRLPKQSLIRHTYEAKQRQVGEVVEA